MTYSSRSSILAFLVSLAFAAGAHAQASRTWVAGLGDDVNPCSRTAPCKTFVGAFNKTAAGGEINVIDPGGYGPISINKSITINGSENLSGVLTDLGNGITINAGPGDRVVLRGLEIEGRGTSAAGIRFIAGASVTVERCNIKGFATGIDAASSTPSARLNVSETNIRANSGVGILLKPTGSGTISATVDKSRVQGCATGLRAEANSFASITDSIFSGNGANGLVAVAGGVINGVRSVSSQNGGGIFANGGTIRITDMSVTDNALHGLRTDAGAILSFGDNKVAGNNPDGAATGSLPLK